MTILYMQHDNAYGYIKVRLFREEDADPLINMGWRREQPGVKADADKGDPEVGSMDWHEAHLKPMETKEDVENYVKELCGADIDKRGSLDKVKKKALKAIADGDSGTGN